jgi:hypothetical protein
VAFLFDPNSQFSGKALVTQVIDASVGSVAVNRLESLDIPWVQIRLDLKDAGSGAAILCLAINAKCDASWPA